MSKIEVHAYESRAQWLNARAEVVGASDVPSIMHIEGAFRTPRQCWDIKMGRAQPDPPSLRMRVGQEIEGGVSVVAAEQLLAKEGLVLSNRAALGFVWGKCQADHPEVSYQLAGTKLRTTPDGFARPVGSDPADTSSWLTADGKNVAWDQMPKWENGPPPHVRAQLQAQMASTGLQRGLVYALLGGGDVKWWVLERNQSFIDSMLGYVESFVEHMAAGKPFGELQPRDAAWLRGQIAPKPKVKHELTEGQVEDARAWIRQKAIAKAAQEEIDRLQARLLDKTKGAGQLTVDGKPIANYTETAAGRRSLTAKRGRNSAEVVLGVTGD